jgi:hypothetical protein
MMHNIIDTQETRRAASLGLDSSLHYPEDFQEDPNESSDVRTKPTAFGKITINDISMNLNNIQQEMEEERHCDSISIGPNGTQLIGSKLRLDDLPSSQGFDRSGLDWEIFHKSTGSSSSSILLRRHNDSAKKPEHGKSELGCNKVVRFQEFEAVSPSCESVSRLRSEEKNNHNC